MKGRQRFRVGQTPIQRILGMRERGEAGTRKVMERDGVAQSLGDAPLLLPYIHQEIIAVKRLPRT